MSNNKLKKIGIMGGTFDPIHYGHLVAAQTARSAYNLDKIVFIPTGDPPHKKGVKVTGKEHRYEMCLLATNSNSYFEVSREEIDREGYSYTIDTLQILKRKYGDKVLFYFITGADALNDIYTWKNWKSLFNMCKFIAVTRPGYNFDEFERNTKKLIEDYKFSIHILKVPLLAISSTGIRKKVKNGHTIKYLLPEAVENYIYNNKIYI